MFYSSSFRRGACPFSSPPAQTAGVVTTIEYTQRSSSETFKIVSSSPHSRITLVDRAGPCQHVWPRAYSNVMRSTATISPASLTSSTWMWPIRSNLPMRIVPPPFLESCFVWSRKQCWYVYSPASRDTHRPCRARKIDAGP